VYTGSALCAKPRRENIATPRKRISLAEQHAKRVGTLVCPLAPMGADIVNLIAVSPTKYLWRSSVD
jgi:hypothetical protein